MMCDCVFFRVFVFVHLISTCAFAHLRGLKHIESKVKCEIFDFTYKLSYKRSFKHLCLICRDSLESRS